MDSLLESITCELEGIEAVYSDTQVIQQPAELTMVAQHVLSKVPKAKPVMTTVVLKATKKGQKDTTKQVLV